MAESSEQIEMEEPSDQIQMAESSDNVEMWLQIDSNVISVTVDAETARKLQEDNQYLQHFGKTLRKNGQVFAKNEDSNCSTDFVTPDNFQQLSENLQFPTQISELKEESKVEDARSSLKDITVDNVVCDQEVPLVPHKCDICGREFSSSGGLNRHLKNIHKEKTYSGCSTKITCALCDFQCERYRAYCSHLQEKHDITIECENIIFENEDEFLIWKSEQEKVSSASFVKNSGSRKVSNGCEHTYFYCHRAGHQRNNLKHGKRLKSFKAQGSCKINRGCPAKISVIKYLDCQPLVEIEYVKTHVGHTMNVRHIPLNAKEKLNLASKLLKGESVYRILDSVCDPLEDTSDGSIKRIQLTTRKDLYNIALQYNINYNKLKNDQDVISIDLWVKEMNEKGSDSPVLVYKPQGSCSSDYPELREDDFMLAIMTSAQIDMLKQYGGGIVCLDSTHVTSAGDFPLTMLMVIDDLRQVFPAAFLFSNKQDEITLGIFFQHIRNKVGVIRPKTFMTDPSESFYNAWKNSMGPVENRIFCSWHVDRAWRKNLRLIKNKKEQEEVYKVLKSLREEKKQLSFDKLLPEIVQGWLDSKTTKQFGEYFLQTYWDQVSCWAYCYRKTCGINTSIHLEAFLKTLKNIHFKGKKIKQLGKFILTLIKFIRDKQYDRLTIYKEILSKKLFLVKQRHDESIKIDFSDIMYMENEEDSYYLVSIPSAKDEAHEVRITNNICYCNFVCSQCNICIHKYTCTCPDYSTHWNICTHIHLVSRKQLCEPFATVAEIDTMESTDDHLFSDEDFLYSDEERLYSDDDNQQEIFANQDSGVTEVTTDQNTETTQMSTETSQLSPETAQISPETAQISPETAQVIPESAQISPDNEQLGTEKDPKSILHVEKKVLKETLQRLLQVIDTCNPSQLKSIKHLLAPIEPTLNGR